MFIRRSVLLACFLCAAAACGEPHLDGSSEQAFRSSILKMGADHSVDDAQRMGADLAAAREKLGADVVRGRMGGMTYGEARAYLDTLASPNPTGIAP